jgi:hypothetical protein
MGTNPTNGTNCVRERFYRALAVGGFGIVTNLAVLGTNF